jgi:hypothetical protein
MGKVWGKYGESASSQNDLASAQQAARVHDEHQVVGWSEMHGARQVGERTLSVSSRDEALGAHL